MRTPDSPPVSTPRKLFIAACWVVVLGVYIAAILPQREAPHLGYSDKVDHMAAFFTVTLLARLSYLRRPVWRLFVAVAAFGALIEITQMIPALHRDAEFNDWVADVAATIVGLIVAQPIVVMIRRYRVREWMSAHLPEQPPRA